MFISVSVGVLVGAGTPALGVGESYSILILNILTGRVMQRGGLGPHPGNVTIRGLLTQHVR